MGTSTPLRALGLTAAAMTCSAASSLLCRAALGRGLADASSFTTVRLLSGALALGGLLASTVPGAGQGEVAGSILMIGSGIAWGVYSLLGRSSRRDPLAGTAAHFACAVPLALVSSLVTAGLGAPHLSAPGVGLAVASGALASGGGYAI